MLNSKDYFLIDENRHLKMTYSELVAALNDLNAFPKYINALNPAELFIQLIASMTIPCEVVLLDSDFSEEELRRLGIDSDVIEQSQVDYKGISFNNVEDVIARINNNPNWKLKLFTSGTTGRPKEVQHNLNSLTRNVKKGDKFKDNVWAFAYNPSHFAGLQVFCQAFFNQNTLVYIFDLKDKGLPEIFETYGITHISATPTFYRTVLPFFKNPLNQVRAVTQGGEKFDAGLVSHLQSIFPNAKIRNIYASTEAGSLFNSSSDEFKIEPEMAKWIKISEDNELMIHRDLLGESDSFSLEGDWYLTGDLVETLDSNTFKFQSRKTEMINVGGYKVNPHEVEAFILELPFVKNIIVFGQKNSILGNILMAQVEILSEYLEANSPEEIEKQIKVHCTASLQKWKVPRQVKIVDKILLTRTGKKVRV